MINGGEIRRQLGANKNQSVKTPAEMHASIIFLFDSKDIHAFFY